MQRMNSNLVLAASQQPDVMNALARGTQAAGMANEVQDANKMRNFFAQNGQGVMSGDQNALAGLAALGPQGAQMAMGAQDRQREFQMQQERLQMARAAGARAAQSAARSANAAQLAAERDEIAKGLAMAYPAIQSGDIARVSEVFTANGLEAPADMDDAMMQIAQFEGAVEVIDRFTGMQPQAPEIPSGAQALEYRARAAGFEPGSPEYQQFMATGGRETPVLNVGADGSVYSGPASVAPKFTEGQSKDNVYATRAEGALALLESVDSAVLTGRLDRALDAVPLGIGREAQSEEFQVAQQAGNELLQAILRKDTGAAITEPEQDLYGKTYLPQPGDGPAVIEAKRNARIRAVEALKSGMSIQQLTVQQRALVNAARQSAQTVNGQPETPDQPPEYLDPLDVDLWDDYTPDQRRIILRAYEGRQ